MNDEIVNAATSLTKMKTTIDFIDWMKTYSSSEDVAVMAIANLDQIASQFKITHPDGKVVMVVNVKDFGSNNGVQLYAGSVIFRFPTNFQIGFALTIMNQKLVHIDTATPGDQETKEVTLN